MKSFYIATLLLITTLVSAQSVDTAFYDHGGYSTFTRNVSLKIEGMVFYHDKNHTLTSIHEYQNGVKEGISTWYYPDGIIQIKIPYKEGVVHGEVISYHPNGRIEWIRPYKHGKMDGLRIVRDATGALVNGAYTTVSVGSVNYTVKCVEGIPNGKFELTQLDGTIALQGQYINGCPDGIFTYFDSEGKVESKQFYKTGTYIKELGDNYEKNVKTYNRILNTDSKNTHFLLLRAEALIHVNKIAMATVDLKKIIELDSSNVLALYNLGYLYAKRKQYKLSEEYLLKCVEFDSSFHRAYYNLGYIYFQRNETKRAIKYFSEAIRAKPDFSEAYYNRAKAYKSDGDEKMHKMDMKKYKKLPKPNKK